MINSIVSGSLKRYLTGLYADLLNTAKDINNLRNTLKNLRGMQKRSNLGLMKSVVAEDIYVFTEMVGCGKIGKVALDSFKWHHPHTIVHVYGTPEDFAWIEPSPNLVFHDLNAQQEILNKFNSGHLGTATLWANIIKSSNAKYLIHFDSDVVFRAPVINEISAFLNSGYDLVGPMRNYKCNPQRIFGIRHLPDVTQTLCFGFNRERITNWNMPTLTKMVQGVYCPFGHNVIDFFDPICFDIIENGGSVFILNGDDYGGFDSSGGRINKYTELNSLIDFGDKLAHFSAVGSGMYYYTNSKHINSSVPRTYIDYALEKYAIFCKIFYGEDIGVEYDRSKYDPLLKVDNWFGRSIKAQANHVID